jgi:DNA-binding response OmpR family regulator
MNQLLLVEDDDAIRLALSLALEDEGYVVVQAPTAAAGLAAFAEREPDLVLLDLRLPDMSGFEVCRLLRASSLVPIIIVTAQTAALRRVHLHETVVPSSVSRFGDIEVRRDQGIVLKGGVELNLTKTEYRLMCEFADHANIVLSRDQLLERVWGYEYLGDSRLVDAHVRRLRVKIEDQPDDPKLIVTARGVGYRLLA